MAQLKERKNKISEETERFHFRCTKRRKIQQAKDENAKVFETIGLPLELWKHIVSYFSPQDLCTCACVCKDLYHLCFDPQVWKECYLRQVRYKPTEEYILRLQVEIKNSNSSSKFKKIQFWREKIQDAILYKKLLHKTFTDHVWPVEFEKFLAIPQVVEDAKAKANENYKSVIKDQGRTEKLRLLFQQEVVDPFYLLTIQIVILMVEMRLDKAAKLWCSYWERVGEFIDKDLLDMLEDCKVGKETTFEAGAGTFYFFKRLLPHSRKTVQLFRSYVKTLERADKLNKNIDKELPYGGIVQMLLKEISSKEKQKKLV